MNFEYTEEQRMIRDMVRDFAENEVRPKLHSIEYEGNYPRDLVKKMAELGLMGLIIPEEYGGAGADNISYALSIEEMSRVSASLAITMSVNSSVCCFPIYTFGNEEQKRKYLVPCAKGEILGGFALTEPNAGSDATAQQTTAVRKGDHYIINGTKNWVTNGQEAQILIVQAMTDPGAGARGISSFIVETNLPGVRMGRNEPKMGLNGSVTNQITFEDVAVPVVNRLGDEGIGFKIAMTSLDGGRIGVASQATGIAQGAYEESVKYAKERTAFNSKLAEFQAIQFMLADMATEIDAARLLAHHAAFLRDQGKPFTKAAAMAKVYASEMANRVTYKAIQIHGGYGYSREYPVERYYREARVTTLYEGTSEIQRIVIARSLLK
ncbi:MAG TPA: acyl-CoA dehydrogenase family protein [Acidobacteriota bacterium]|nr:acyl-CoA dehydrogenase family protein [Acidobacteriota bacterium]